MSHPNGGKEHPDTMYIHGIIMKLQFPYQDLCWHVCKCCYDNNAICVVRAVTESHFTEVANDLRRIKCRSTL